MRGLLLSLGPAQSGLSFAGTAGAALAEQAVAARCGLDLPRRATGAGGKVLAAAFMVSLRAQLSIQTLPVLRIILHADLGPSPNIDLLAVHDQRFGR